MSGSGNRINYNVRTCKSIERKMILTVLTELFKDIPYEKRRYIGFGSTYFTDFKLFHKELHVNRMISFESEPDILERVEFNKPYKCIEIVNGKSTDKLPFISWDENMTDFIWMDYDDELNYDMFNDVEIIFSKIQRGSVYLMTCNKRLKDYNKKSFDECFGELSPSDIKENDFTGENDSFLIRRMFINKISSTLQNRNYSLDESQQLLFRPLFFFTYRDGAPMISFGGYIDLKLNAFSLAKYNLSNFEFIRENADRYTIDPPVISFKEANLLNTYLPNPKENFEEDLKFIPKDDIKRYMKLYKFLPNYMDVIN